MAVVENGRAVENTKDRPNGHAMIHTTSTKRRAPPRKTWYNWALNNLARLTIWYTLLTVIFRCPSNPKGLTDSSPQICESYLTTKAYVQPHIQPYYDIYAAPYLEKAGPYVDQVNTYVVAPTKSIVTKTYQKVAAARMEKARLFCVSKWDQLVLPQVLVAQERATSLYASNVGPHVSKASSMVSPYYEQARENAAIVHEQRVLPAIEYSKPRLQTVYLASEKFVLTTALPLTQHAWSHFVIFVEGTLWPFVKGLYSDNVRPQLVMISERITKYQEGRKLQAVMEEAESSMDTTSTSTTNTPSIETATPTDVAETVKAFMSSIMNDASTAVEEVSSSVLPKPSRQIQHATEESITEDLVKWQKKFADAADKGTDDLRDRVKGIVASLVQSDIDHEGRGLASALEKTTVLEVENLKSKIRSVIASLPDEASDSQLAEAEEDVMQAVRKSGVEIRDRAKKVRDWSSKFQHEVTHQTSLATESTLQILDSIRDLGLQEIGMRWAWMEGVTYKHWQKYHDLRQRFDEWRNEVRDIAVAHPDAIEAQELAEQILEESMANTEAAAKELFRLKDVAKWKVRARDATDDFESRALPAAVVSAASKFASEVADKTQSLVGSTQGTIESLGSYISESATDVSKAAASVVDRASASVAPVVSKASDSIEGVASDISSVVVGSSTGRVESAASQAKASLSSASAQYIGSSTGRVESLASAAASSLSSASVEYIGSSSGSAESLISQASAKIIGSSTGVVEAVSLSVSSLADEIYDSANSIGSVASSSASSAGSSRFFAVAQEVKGSAPILDDVFDDDTSSKFSSSVQSIVDSAGTQYDVITKALSEALYGTSTGSVESMTSLAASQYSQALSAASVALYGSSTGTVESVASQVSDRYYQAVAAASSVIFASAQPTTVTESFRSLYDEALSKAAEYSSMAQSVVSAQISGTPRPIHEQMLQSISAAYISAVDSASLRFGQAAEGVSEQYSSLSSAAMPTQDRLGSLSAAASSRLQEALAAASSQYNNVKVAVGAEPTPVAMQAQQSYYAAIGYAYAQYSELVSSGSSLAYGTPTPTPVYEQLISAAKSRYSVASSAASLSFSSMASIASSTKSPAQGVLEQASLTYASFLSEASASLASASEQASIAVLGTKKPVYEAALSSISAQYVAATVVAADSLADLLSSASSVVGKTTKSPAQSVLDSISLQYEAVIAAASSSVSAASASASSLYYGPPAGSFESFTGAASDNWEQLISAASVKIYSQPTPVWASATSAAAQVTDAAAERFVIVQAYVSEILVGRDQIYTESVMSKLSSQYYGYGASASSIASEIVASGASVMSSVSSIASDSAGEVIASGASVMSSVSSVASSAVSSFFTTPPEVNSILADVNSRLQDAVDAASTAAYGSSTGYLEQASSAVADSYASASSAVSEQIYGTSIGYTEAASSSMAEAAASASAAISAAIFGVPQPSGVSASISSAASAAQSSVSSLLYGEQQGAFDSAWSSVQEAISAANIKMADFSAQASDVAGSVSAEISKTIEQAASVVGDTVSSVTSRVKDEL